MRRWPKVLVGDKPAEVRAFSSVRIVHGRKTINLRVPMTMLREVWPHIRQDDVFEFAAYPGAGVIVLRRVDS